MSELGKRTAAEGPALEIVKLNDIEHALHAADFYIGQAVHTESPEVSRFVYNPQTQLMEYQTAVRYPHGLLKIFDEALVNAADNRHKGTSTIKVGVSLLHNSVWIYNDGPNFAIVPTDHASRWNPQEKAYQPEVAFFHCKTSSAYGKKQRITGGKFGLGAKLIAIFSSWCSIEMCDGHTYYFQKAENHMNDVKPPVVKPCKPDEKPYLALCFSPDLSLFYPPGQAPPKIPELMVNLFLTRALDIAGTVPKDVKVLWSLNRNQFLAPKACKFERLPVKGFKDYVKLFLPLELKEQLDHPESAGLKIAYHSQPRWEICMISNPWPFPVNVSFVNNINTYMGGEHIKYIQSQVHQFCKTKVEGIDARRVQQAVMVFVNATIEDPAFTSQCKELLQTLPKQFGSECQLPEKFFNTLLRNGVMDNLKSEMEVKDMAMARRTIGAGKTRSVHDIVELRDARFAGTRQASKCTVYFVEGASAMALAEVGISVLGSDYVGAFPVKGKVINSDTSIKRLQKNKEFINICRVLGVEPGKPVQRSQLRYGRMVVLTDADPDGSHIRGLIMYMFSKFWPELLKEGGFLDFMVTPIVVAKAKNTTQTPVHYFYTLPSFQTWLQTATSSRWDIKYYKGLGTSTTKEGRYYFKHLREHIRNFSAATDEDFQALFMAFNQKNKDASQKRKEWLTTYDHHKFIPYDHLKQVPIHRFINEDLIHFSWLSVCRAIPAYEDGLTPAARKCLWTMLQRKVIHDEKVSILQSYVDKDTHYHHGADSLGKTIIRLAQTFVGSQNINLFFPSGQFGTRVDGGKKTVAATRYIFSRLMPLTRKLFHPDDDQILEQMEDEGFTIEPRFMTPVIPLLLVNGANQVGTAYACKIPCYRPEDVIAAVERKLDGQPWQPLTPWYHQFTGTITGDPKGHFTSKGVVQKVSDRVWNITELPLRLWRLDYKAKLSAMVEAGDIEGFHEKHRNSEVCFEVTLKKAPADNFNPYAFFKLQNKFTANMNVFVTEEKKDAQIHSFATVEDLFNRWFAFRLPWYERRRQCLIQALERQIPFLKCKVEFLRILIEGRLKLGRKRQVLSDELAGVHHIPVEFHTKLFQMDLSSVSEERVLAIQQEWVATQTQLEEYQTLTPQALWRQDLEALKMALTTFWDTRLPEDETEEDDATGKPQTRPKKKRKQ